MTDGEEAAAADGEEREEAGAHMDGLHDGCGCAETWERLSELRDD